MTGMQVAQHHARRYGTRAGVATRRDDVGTPSVPGVAPGRGYERLPPGVLVFLEKRQALWIRLQTWKVHWYTQVCTGQNS